MSNLFYYPIKNIENSTIETVIEEYENTDVVVSELKVADGSIADPSIAFQDELTTGFSRPSSGTIGVSGSGSEIASLSTSLSSFQSPIVIDATNAEALLVRKNGDSGDILVVDTFNDTVTCNSTFDVNSQFAVNATDITINEKVIIDDTDTEAFLVRKDADGGDIFKVDTTNSQVRIADGTVSLPSLALDTDSDTGFYKTAIGGIGFSSYGSNILTFSNGGLTLSSTVGITAGNSGTVSAPNYRFDSNTGIYSDANDAMGFSCSGANVAYMTGGQALFDGRIIIDRTDTEALLVRKDTDTGDIFRVDTTNSQTLVSAGSVSLPSYSFIGDTDTGMYNIANTSINFSVSGVNNVFMNASSLRVPQSIQLLFQRFDGLYGQHSILSSTTDNTEFIFQNVGGAGKIVHQFGSAGGTTIRPNSTTTQNCELLLQKGDGASSYVDVFKVDENVISSIVPQRMADGTASAPSYSFTSDTNTGLYSAGADTLGFSCGGSNQLSISSSSSTFTGNLVIPANGTVYNSGNDGLKVSNTSSYTALVENAVECFRVSSDTNVVNCQVGYVINNNGIGNGNYLRYGGTLGDSNNGHTVIAERIYQDLSEKSELLLFKGNDTVGASGPDRIRCRSAQIVFQTYTSPESITGTTVNDDNTRLTIGTTDITSTVNLIIPADGTVYNSGNDGLKVSNTSGYTALVENAVECIKVSSTQNTHRSALHTFTPSTVLNTTIDYKFQVGSGVAYTDLLTIDETEILGHIPYRGSSGSASAPSLSFRLDPNSGIYSSAGDEVAVSAGGTKMFSVSSSKTSTFSDSLQLKVDSATRLGGDDGEIFYWDDATNPGPVFCRGGSWYYFWDNTTPAF